MIGYKIIELSRNPAVVFGHKFYVHKANQSMPRHHIKSGGLPSGNNVVKKPNYQNIMMVTVFIVGGYLIYRMISSVQKQLLLVKQEVSNMKTDMQNSSLPSTAGQTQGFEFHFEQGDTADDVSVDSVDIDKIMAKLSAGDEDSVKNCKKYLAALKEEIDESVRGKMDYARVTGGAVSSQSEDTVEGNEVTTMPGEQPNERGKELPDDKGESSDRVVEITEDLSKKSLVELKKMVKDKGLSVKGNKAQLIQALEASE